MLVNGKEVNVDELVSDLKIEENFLKKRENGLYLNDYQVNVLNRSGINYLDYHNLSSLLFALNEMQNEQDLEDLELDQVIMELQEIHYYQETHK